MTKKVTVAVVLVLFIFGIFFMFLLVPRNRSATNANKPVRTSQNGSQDSGDVAGHHSKISSTDDSNKDISTIKLLEAIEKPAPDFTLTDQSGSEFTLSDYKDKTVVLFFSGGAMCYPACWNQIAELGNDTRFNNDNVISAAIVVDSKEEWDKIIASQPKYGTGTILYDTNRAVSQAYSVLDVPSSMHKGSFPGHTYIVVKNGIISYVLDDPKMALNNEELALNL